MISFEDLNLASDYRYLKFSEMWEEMPAIHLSLILSSEVNRILTSTITPCLSDLSNWGP